MFLTQCPAQQQAVWQRQHVSGLQIQKDQSPSEFAATWPRDLGHSELLSAFLEHGYWLCGLVDSSCYYFHLPWNAPLK